MAFFSVGDKVTIRSDIKEKCYKMREGSIKGVLAGPPILECSGMRVIIKAIKHESPAYYYVETRYGDKAASDEMFQEYIDYVNGAGPFVEFEVPDRDTLLSMLLQKREVN